MEKTGCLKLCSPQKHARILGDKNGESISLLYDRIEMVVMSKTNFENSAVDQFINDDVAMWRGHKGEMVITKVDYKSAEGTFLLYCNWQ